MTSGSEAVHVGRQDYLRGELGLAAGCDLAGSGAVPYAYRVLNGSEHGSEAARI